MCDSTGRIGTYPREINVLLATDHVIAFYTIFEARVFGFVLSTRIMSGATTSFRLGRVMGGALGCWYFTFMNYRGVDPTNNRTEQQIRFVVIGRKVTQGTKAPVGKQWCERIWTTLATCRQRGKHLYQFLVESIQATIGNRSCYPSLIY